MTKLSISHPTGKVSGRLHLNGSKSISNRILIIKALCGIDFQLRNVSSSKDTNTLISLLEKVDQVTTFDAGHAGTTFRFMTAFLALRQGNQILTGSQRMLQRPIGPLVEALNTLGANIEHIDNQGFPPLSIHSPMEETGGEVSISGEVSSQFLSALLLVGPYLSKGLKLNIVGDLVSRPYLEMTVNLMQHFGADIVWSENRIEVGPGAYTARDYYVEGDWSSASYLFEICSLARHASIEITGLRPNSIQGDARIKTYTESLGVESRFEDDVLYLNKQADYSFPEMIEFHLIKEPDLTQTLVCTCAGLGVGSIYSGLKTLKIKETDRIAALRNELLKMHVFFTELPKRLAGQSEDSYYMLSEQVLKSEEQIEIETYEDHRMALAFAPLSLIRPLVINDSNVVIKSYPEYWDHLELLGFEIEKD